MVSLGQCQDCKAAHTAAPDWHWSWHMHPREELRGIMSLGNIWWFSVRFRRTQVWTSDLIICQLQRTRTLITRWQNCSEARDDVGAPRRRAVSGWGLTEKELILLCFPFVHLAVSPLLQQQHYQHLEKKKNVGWKPLKGCCCFLQQCPTDSQGKPR